MVWFRSWNIGWLEHSVQSTEIPKWAFLGEYSEAEFEMPIGSSSRTEYVEVWHLRKSGLETILDYMYLGVAGWLKLPSLSLWSKMRRGSEENAVTEAK